MSSVNNLLNEVARFLVKILAIYGGAHLAIMIMGVMVGWLNYELMIIAKVAAYTFAALVIGLIVIVAVLKSRQRPARIVEDGPESEAIKLPENMNELEFAESVIKSKEQLSLNDIDDLLSKYHSYETFKLKVMNLRKFWTDGKRHENPNADNYRNPAWSRYRIKKYEKIKAEEAKGPSPINLTIA